MSFTFQFLSEKFLSLSCSNITSSVKPRESLVPPCLYLQPAIYHVAFNSVYLTFNVLIRSCGPGVRIKIILSSFQGLCYIPDINVIYCILNEPRGWNHLYRCNGWHQSSEWLNQRSEGWNCLLLGMLSYREGRGGSREDRQGTDKRQCSSETTVILKYSPITDSRDQEFSGDTQELF